MDSAVKSFPEFRLIGPKLVLGSDCSCQQLSEWLAASSTRNWGRFGCVDGESKSLGPNQVLTFFKEGLLGIVRLLSVHMIKI